jgi:uncharacterized integral membrane protein
MDAGAIVLMVIGMAIIWGGLIASIAYAIRIGRHRKQGDSGF